jgi:hypothetical protein
VYAKSCVVDNRVHDRVLSCYFERSSVAFGCVTSQNLRPSLSSCQLPLLVQLGWKSNAGGVKLIPSIHPGDVVFGLSLLNHILRSL